MAKADPRQFRTAKIFDQAIVATTGGDRILGAETAGDHLEGGLGVVIKASYHARS